MIDQREYFKEIVAGYRARPQDEAIGVALDFNDSGLWEKILSEPERAIWLMIRSLFIPLVPQYPVMGYMADFADPLHKIILEIDGKHHKNQVAKDQARDQKCREYGWAVFRVPAKKVYDRAMIRELLELAIFYHEVGYFSNYPVEQTQEAFTNISTGCAVVGLARTTVQDKQTLDLDTIMQLGRMGLQNV